MFRLAQKHSRNLGRAAPVSAERLIRAQSVRAAITAAGIAIICFDVMWAYTAAASGRFFPWGSILQGAIIGFAVRYAGRGLDWRFPLIAGAASLIGSFGGNLFIAVMFTRSETGAVGSWREVLQGFFANTVTVIDVIYAFCAVAVAVFFSKRRLNRHEVFALRTYSAGRNGKK